MKSHFPNRSRGYIKGLVRVLKDGVPELIFDITVKYWNVFTGHRKLKPMAEGGKFVLCRPQYSTIKKADYKKLKAIAEEMTNPALVENKPS